MASEKGTTAVLRREVDVLLASLLFRRCTRGKRQNKLSELAFAINQEQEVGRIYFLFPATLLMRQIREVRRVSPSRGDGKRHAYGHALLSALRR